jgi:uncharacterized membrane protein YccC
MTLPSWRDWLFSGKAFLASMLALYIALALDLPRPYWAMAAVYVVANPLSGATVSKGLYRALGTLIGASAAVFFVPLFVNAPELLSLVVALWVGCLLFISMLDRTPRSYVFMLAGYSLPLIALPDVGTPDLIFDTALARSEEIILGITCASVVGAVLFPTSVGTLLAARVDTWLGDAATWIDEILRGAGAIPATPVHRQRLAADIAGLDMIITQLSYDAVSRDVTRHARELRGCLMMLLPLLSSLADRLHALKNEKGTLPPDIAALLADLADWFAQGRTADAAEADRLLARIAALAPGEQTAWHDMIVSSALSRMSEIIDLWRDCQTLRDAIAGRAEDRRLVLRHTRLVTRVRHYDIPLLVFYAGSVAASTFAAALFWIFSGWSSGAGFVMMAAVAGSFFALQDRPAPMIRSMLVWCGVSLLCAGFYLFAVLPLIQGYEMLVVVFAPPFLLLGLLIPRPQFNMIGMLMAVNTASFVALQNQYNADFSTFVNEGLGAMFGIGFALAWTLALRPFGAELTARRLVWAGWRDIADTAATLRPQDQARLTGRMLDRLGQLVPRVAGLDEGALANMDGFAEVRIGFNVIELQRERAQLSQPEAVTINTVLRGIANLFGDRVARRQAVAPSEGLRHDIDAALAATRQGNRAAAHALVGLRRVLFPNAPGPEGRKPEVPQLLAAE